MRRFLGLVVLLLLSAGLNAQILEPVRFQTSSRTQNDTLLVILKGRIEPSWHVYDTGLEPGGPISARFEAEILEGARLAGPLRSAYPSQKAHDPVFDMDVAYFTDSVTFLQPIILDGEAYRVEGFLEYGACNDKNCLPPTKVEVSFMNRALSASAVDETGLFQGDIYQSVKDQMDLSATGGSHSLFWIFMSGLLGGLLALLTPCVWPIIPLTVSFFLKRSQNHGKAVASALIYGLSIVVIYMALALLVTLIFGASALNALSTNAFFNLFFFLLLLLFGLSFLGAFDLSLPSSWTNSVDKAADRHSGWASLFLMALCLTLVSFSCTGPIVGFLLVEVSQENAILGPSMGMLGFSLALALPFTLFALFPGLLKKAPRHLGGLSALKVVLGFVELYFSLKFLSVADLAYGWHILDRETFLCLWIALSLILSAYLLGWVRFPVDDDEGGDRKVGTLRFLTALPALSFAIYMIPGLWGAPLKAISAFSPPLSTQDFSLYDQEVRSAFNDYEKGMEYAQKMHKPVLLDFTGYGCVNCRKMELSVWTDSKVSALLGEYVMISLYVDDKTPLEGGSVLVDDGGSARRIRSLGDKWSYLQRLKFGANAQPFYVLLDNEGKPLAPSYGFDEDPAHFAAFLETGLREFRNQ